MYLSPVRIVIWVTPDAQMTIGAAPALRHLQGRVVGVEFSLVLLALAHLVKRELLDSLVRAVAAQEHLYQLVDRRFLGDQ